jgi:nucleotide-binding universal stress UspA family protein
VSIVWKKVLCPVDFSLCSREALRVAVALSNQFEADLVLLHVHELPGLTLPTGDLILSSSMAAGAELQAAQGLEKAKQEAIDFGGNRVTTASRIGAPFREITCFAVEENCELIVLGTHGRTGLKHALLGSVAERVVRLASCPVLTVRFPASSPDGEP